MNGEWNKPRDSSTKGKMAFLLMINDCRGEKASTYMGFISMGRFPAPPRALLLFNLLLELSFCTVTLRRGFISS